MPKLLDELYKLGYQPTLVGGAVRDYLLTEELGQDWDLELTHNTVAFSRDAWKDLGKRLASFGKVTYLAYEVIRLTKDSYHVELSPPRVESFVDELAHAGHKNFTVEFNFKMPFEEAIKRRDFSINAMGLRILQEKIEFLDPLNAVMDIRDKVLRPCGEDFAKDPVRFLRAIRFAIKLGFDFSPELEKTLQVMSVADFSHTYFWSEMQKSNDPVKFLEKVSSFKKYHPEIKLPWAPTTVAPDLKRFLSHASLHEAWVIALEWVGESSDSWRDYFLLSADSCKRLARWTASSKEFLHIHPEIFHGEFEAVLQKAEFESLFDWYFNTKHILQKYPELPLLNMIEDCLPEWIHLYKFDVIKDVKHIDPPLRAKYQVWNLCQRL